MDQPRNVRYLNGTASNGTKSGRYVGMASNGTKSGMCIGSASNGTKSGRCTVTAWNGNLVVSRSFAGTSASNGSSYPPPNRQELPSNFLLPPVLQIVCSGTKIEIMTEKNCLNFSS